MFSIKVLFQCIAWSSLAWLSRGSGWYEHPRSRPCLRQRYCALAHREMQDLLEAVYRHAAAVGMRIEALKIKMTSALNPGEQRPAVLLDGAPLEDVDKFKYFGFIFISNGQGTEEIRRRINLARCGFSHLQSCLWSRHEISLRTKDRFYQAVVSKWPSHLQHPKSLRRAT